jgi:hypothetical protein
MNQKLKPKDGVESGGVRMTAGPDYSHEVERSKGISVLCRRAGTGMPGSREYEREFTSLLLKYDIKKGGLKYLLDALYRLEYTRHLAGKV